MTWKELNWFQFEGSVFTEELKGTFSRIFELTEADLRESRARRDRDISNQPDNEHILNELSWSEERLRSQSHLLTAMIFTVTFRYKPF